MTDTQGLRDKIARAIHDWDCGCDGACLNTIFADGRRERRCRCCDLPMPIHYREIADAVLPIVEAEVESLRAKLSAVEALADELDALHENAKAVPDADYLRGRAYAYSVAARRLRLAIQVDTEKENQR